MRLLYLLPVVILISFLFVNCSEIKINPAEAVSPDRLLPAEPANPNIYDLHYGLSSNDLLAVYNLTITPDFSFAELIPLRKSALGESYLVSGKSYFTTTPCSDCLSIISIGLDAEENIIIRFSITHPFEKGNPSYPPSGKNRLDLDIFDIALLLVPQNTMSQSYLLTGTQIYSEIMLNADGYTPELGNLTGEDIVVPYRICFGNQNHNRFEMGTQSHEFDVLISPGELQFTLFLTMGYGASADFEHRLDPTYYIPEFNRKAAWKVDVAPQTWEDSLPSTVIINVYDWNHGAEISPTFPDPDNTDHISASSDIEAVTVEVPGMTDALIEATTTDTVTNGWDDPITYEATFSNENLLPEGEYVGLVKVTDSRDPGTHILGGEPDTLVHSPDGIERQWFNIPEFATYQTFTAIIAPSGPETGWALTWGKPESMPVEACYPRDVILDSGRNIYVIGDYVGDIDFDPGPGEEWRSSIGGTADTFLSKFDRNGNFIRVLTWGSEHFAGCQGLCLDIDSVGNVYVGGTFWESVDFDPGPETEIRTAAQFESNLFISKFDPDGVFQWVLTYASYGLQNTEAIHIDESDNIYYCGIMPMFLAKCDSEGNNQWRKEWYTTEVGDLALGVTTDNSENIYVTGCFFGECDFDPGSGELFIEPGGQRDVFLSKFSSDGIFLDVQTWGGTQLNQNAWGKTLITDNSGNILVGGYTEGIVDFDPGLDEDNLGELGNKYAFLSKFDENGIYLWAGIWNTQPFFETGELDIACDNDGNTFVAGSFKGTVDFDPGSGVVEYTAPNFMHDMYISKLDTNGNLTWVRVWGGDNNEFIFGNATDNLNNVYVVGTFSSTMDFDPGTGIDEHSHIDAYSFLMKVLPNGYWE